MASSAGFEPTAFRLGGGRSILLSYGNNLRFFLYLCGFPAFEVQEPRCQICSFFVRKIRVSLNFSNKVVYCVMEQTTLLDGKSIFYPPKIVQTEKNQSFVENNLRRRTLYPAELRKLACTSYYPNKKKSSFRMKGIFFRKT